ncbi:YqcI/YcgG family protein [Shimazuella kribbensis]|uniref:YqcI/YcgG family protein n=1 Tax=Shimazuella kribbensis TaxID=139808 RepID=UPI00040AD57E|nr:YqcI/YcgG family protein [Shimazuella kribbensis]
MVTLIDQELIKNAGSFLPDWFHTQYQTFRSTVLQPTFPCYFGMNGEKKGELRYGFISQDDWSNLPETLKEFHELMKERPLVRRGLFIFVEPEKEEKSLSYYRDYFWNVLQYLHEKDEKPWPEHIPKDPEHYLWTFGFHGETYFAFGNCPAYKQRKTRDLGNSLIIGFQPRVIFEGLEGTSEWGSMSREKVRERVAVWDNLPKHPDISHYGDPTHHEWKQFFIGDDIVPIRGKCPFQPK